MRLAAPGRLHDHSGALSRALWGSTWLSWQPGGAQSATCRLPPGGEVQVQEDGGDWAVHLVRVDPRHASWIEGALRAAFDGGPAPGPPSWFTPAPAAVEALADWINGVWYQSTVWVKSGRVDDLRDPRTARHCARTGEQAAAVAAAFVDELLLEHLPEEGPLVELERSVWVPDTEDVLASLLDGASCELAEVAAVLPRLHPAARRLAAVGDCVAVLLLDEQHATLVFEA